MFDADRWRESRPTRRGQAWVKRGGEQTAVYSQSTGALHLLNASALAIWEISDGETTGLEMAEAIAELTGLGVDEALEDVVQALDRLAELNLVER